MNRWTNGGFISYWIFLFCCFVWLVHIWFLSAQNFTFVNELHVEYICFSWYSCCFVLFKLFYGYMHSKQNNNKLTNYQQKKNIKTTNKDQQVTGGFIGLKVMNTLFLSRLKQNSGMYILEERENGRRRAFYIWYTV